jgi:hypothetical protein
VVVLALLAWSCAIPADSGQAPDLPDSKSFIDNNVSLFMERRCGSLDCHGQVGRPLRIYSEWGLRLHTGDNNTRDKRPTQPDERLENYLAVVGLDPENLAICFDKNSDGTAYDSLQLLKKPLDISGGGIRHKGGPVLHQSQSDKGWACLHNWACAGPDTLNAADCTAAAKYPQPP